MLWLGREDFFLSSCSAKHIVLDEKDVERHMRDQGKSTVGRSSVRTLFLLIAWLKNSVNLAGCLIDNVIVNKVSQNSP